MIQQNEINNENSVSNKPVSIGRKKPALPPKPPNPLRLSLPRGYSCITANRSNKSKLKIDPVELSLKERLALFEKNKHTILVPNTLGNKKQWKMSIPSKPASTNRKIKDNDNGFLYVPHTANLMKSRHHKRTIICGNRFFLI